MPWYYDFQKQHSNAFLRFVRHIYRQALHFDKGYNFPLWVIFGGAIFGFGCARAMYLDINGILANAKTATGDWEYWQSGHYHIGIILHLAGVIPICFLVPWQFLPIVRHVAMLFHRLNGTLLVLLLLMANAGGFMIARRSLGGTVEAQTIFGFIGIYSTVSLILAYVNIKRLQIDQHRAWMLRTWFGAAAVISQRIIQIPTYQIVTNMGDYYFPMACHTIDYVSTQTVGRSQMMQYAACREDPINGWAAVRQDMTGGANGQGPPMIASIAAGVNGSFATSGFLAILLHVLGIEMYLWLTRAEGDRLKQASYEKQVARGWKRPGDSSYLTPHMWGDLPPWHPQRKEEHLMVPGGVLSSGEESDSVVKENTPEDRV